MYAPVPPLADTTILPLFAPQAASFVASIMAVGVGVVVIVNVSEKLQLFVS